MDVRALDKPDCELPRELGVDHEHLSAGVHSLEERSVGLPAGIAQPRCEKGNTSSSLVLKSEQPRERKESAPLLSERVSLSRCPLLSPNCHLKQTRPNRGFAAISNLGSSATLSARYWASATWCRMNFRRLSAPYVRRIKNSFKDLQRR